MTGPRSCKTAERSNHRPSGIERNRILLYQFLAAEIRGVALFHMGSGDSESYKRTLTFLGKL